MEEKDEVASKQVGDILEGLINTMEMSLLTGGLCGVEFIVSAEPGSEAKEVLVVSASGPAIEGLREYLKSKHLTLRILGDDPVQEALDSTN